LVFFLLVRRVPWACLVGGVLQLLLEPLFFHKFLHFLFSHALDNGAIVVAATLAFPVDVVSLNKRETLGCEIAFVFQELPPLFSLFVIEVLVFFAFARN